MISRQPASVTHTDQFLEFDDCTRTNNRLLLITLFMGDSNETIEVNLQDENIDSKPSIVIAKALATFEGVDPETLPTACGIRLHDYVDPDALDKLVSSDEDVSILFDIEDYRVKVSNPKLEVEEIYHS